MNGECQRFTITHDNQIRRSKSSEHVSWDFYFKNVMTVEKLFNFFFKKKPCRTPRYNFFDELFCINSVVEQRQCVMEQ